MPSRISQTAGSIEGVKSTFSGLWFLVKKLFPFVVVILVVVFIIFIYLKLVARKMSTAFGRRKIEIDKGAKASKDPSIKAVYYYKGDKNIYLGKYKGHIISKYSNVKTDKNGRNIVSKPESFLFVLISKGWLSDIFNGPMLVCAPTNAIKHLWIKNKQNMLLVGKSFSYDTKKDMYFLTGDWAGFKIMVSKMLCDDNILELMQDYVGKLFPVQDQMIQQLDIDLKKKMKGVEDVVEND